MGIHVNWYNYWDEKKRVYVAPVAWRYLLTRIGNLSWVGQLVLACTTRARAARPESLDKIRGNPAHRRHLLAIVPTVA